MKTIFYWVVYPLWRPVYLLSLVLDTVAVCSLILLLSLWDHRGNAVHYIGRFWSLLNIYLSGTRLELLGGDKIVRGRPYILMANHQSLLDVWALIGCLPLQLRWIVKAEIRKVPLFGLTLARLGHIYIDRKKRQVAYHRLAAAATKIRAGNSVVIFPEGTRSTDGHLLRFRPGEATIADQAQVAILPVTLNGSRFALPKGTLGLMPGRVQIVVADPIEPQDYRRLSKAELMAAVKAAIEANLDLRYGALN